LLDSFNLSKWKFSFNTDLNSRLHLSSGCCYPVQRQQAWQLGLYCHPHPFMCSFFLFLFARPTDWPTFMRGRAIGNETFYGDGLMKIEWCLLKNCAVCISPLVCSLSFTLTICIKAGVNMKAVFWLGITVLGQISRWRFKQSGISLLISHIYVLGRFVIFLVIFRYIWR